MKSRQTATEKQAAFFREYINNGRNAYAAYVEVYNTKDNGYLQQAAQRVLKSKAVQELLRKHEARVNLLLGNSIVEQIKVLETLRDEARINGDMGAAIQAQTTILKLSGYDLKEKIYIRDTLDENSSYSDHAKEIIKRMGMGEISPEIAGKSLSAVTKAAGFEQTGESEVKIYLTKDEIGL